MVAIGPFQLDLANQRLERDGREVDLSPKAFAVLRHLSSRPGSLVTKQELLDTVWPNTFVQEGVLKAYVKEIRKALGDDADNPRYIRTEHRRGYCFLKAAGAGGEGAAPLIASKLVGRQADLQTLRNTYDQSPSGDCRIVFLLGEAGIGKTALIDEFLSSIGGDANLFLARGQCIEQSGEGEPYLPLFDAITHLCRQHGTAEITETLRKHAPMWLMQMPSLVAPEERQKLQMELVGSNSQRMIREMIEVLAALTANRRLVLALEDLHWADPSTVDLLGALARRADLRRLLVIASYRPVEVILSRHPVRALKQELQIRGQCRELALELLPLGAVEQYIASRFPSADALGQGTLAGFAAHLHRRTDGNPLFLINVTDYLVDQGAILTEGDNWRLAMPAEQLAPAVPENLRQMIERQFEWLPPEQQRILEAGSVAGMEFSSEMIAAATGMNAIEVEEACETVEESHLFLRHGGVHESPGDNSERFTFVHALHKEALYQRINTTRRRRLHLALGEHGARTEASAASSAAHFELGGDAAKAIHYLGRAALQAAQRYAKREALDHLNRAQRLLVRLPISEQADSEIAIRRLRAEILRSFGDAASAMTEFEALADRAQELGKPHIAVFAILHGTTSMMWVDRPRCVAASERAVALSASLSDAPLQLCARGTLAFWRLLLLEWSEVDAVAFEQAFQAATQGDSPALEAAFQWMATAYFGMRSDYRQSLKCSDRCLELALAAGDAYHYLATLHFRFLALIHMGQMSATLRTFEQVARMSEYSGFVGVVGSEAMWRKVLHSVGTAWVRLLSHDYETAISLSLPLWRDMRVASSMIGSGSVVYAARVGAEALLGLGRVEEARAVLEEVDAHVLEHNLHMEPRVQLLHRLAWARQLLREGQLNQAATFADSVLEMAQRPGERTYISLAKSTSAEILLAQGRKAEALEAAASACAAIEGIESHAAWKAFHTAVRCASAAGENAIAAKYRDKAQRAVGRFVVSLEGYPELEQSFTAHPDIRLLMANAELPVAI